MARERDDFTGRRRSTTIAPEIRGASVLLRWERRALRAAEDVCTRRFAARLKTGVLGRQGAGIDEEVDLVGHRRLRRA